MNFKKPKFWDDSGLSFWSIILYPFSIIFLLSTLLIRFFKNLLTKDIIKNKRENGYNIIDQIDNPELSQNSGFLKFIN